MLFLATAETIRELANSLACRADLVVIDNSIDRDVVNPGLVCQLSLG
jgi:hypothetical protein